MSRSSFPFNPAKRAFTLLDEFKAFAFKGNVIDLAVGVIIGGAFGKIIESMVKNLIMPLISALFGGNPQEATKGLESLSAPIRGVQVPYGAFLADFANFLILACVLFLVIVKFLGWVLKSRKEEAEAPPPPPAPEILLLTEIRDLLKTKSPTP
ncbi:MULTISPECIES: large conductance mechanosensitive channel protein MscL [unclassified Schlesneria]|uniref:large conductance mechanosensitive channel protein MscL n=1 Tax=Schlesneria TaxID=656899 RepID=UPI0035A09370